MATPEENAFEGLLAVARTPLAEARWQHPSDLSRMSVEAMHLRSGGEPRELRSCGSLRMSGVGVIRDAAGLDQVGAIATLWQRCITAVGAAIEGVSSLRGRLPAYIVLRTQLLLNTSPGPGSVVLSLSPQSDPFAEVAPSGQRQMEAPRPLADLASERLIDLLSQAQHADIEANSLGASLRDLGPRVSSTVRALASALDSAHFDVDATWAEPQQDTRRASLSAGTAGWLRDFVSGRALDTYEDELLGTVRTVSDVSKWVIEAADEELRTVDASELDAGTVRVGETVRLRVIVKTVERPDGSSRVTMTAAEILERIGD